ncbi:MAG: hypothetical protein R2856_24385 [Caldilineaceae bacterium]
MIEHEAALLSANAADTLDIVVWMFANGQATYGERRGVGRPLAAAQVARNDIRRVGRSVNCAGGYEIIGVQRRDLLCIIGDAQAQRNRLDHLDAVAQIQQTIT